MNKGIKTIAEGHNILLRNQEEMKSELGSVKAAVMDVDAKVKGIDIKVDEIDMRLKKVEQKLDTVTDDHEHRLQKLEAVG